MERIDEQVDAEYLVDAIWPFLSDMEAAVCILYMAGFSFVEIGRHFEWSEDRVYRVLYDIRKMIEQMLELDSEYQKRMGDPDRCRRPRYVYENEQVFYPLQMTLSL